MPFFIFKTVMILLSAASLLLSSPTDSLEIESLRKILMQEDPNVQYGLRVGPDDLRLEAIKQLGDIGSAQAANVLREFLTDNNMNRKLKQHALVALGQIGTGPAVDAIKQFEAWSRKRFSRQKTFRFGPQESAIDHFGPFYVEPLAQTTDEKNKIWAILPLNRYGQMDFWLTSLLENDLWSEPVLLNLPELPRPVRTSETTWNIQCQLQIKNDSIIINYNDQVVESRISDHLQDSDKDGLSDIVETRLLTDPNNPDSDKDGLPDGQDSNPLLPTHDQVDDITEIRQAVFSALFATCNSQNAIVVVERGDFATQEYYGYSGFVLHLPETRQGFVNITSIDVKLDSVDTATASIRDWEASEAASGHEAKLKKVYGKWVVVEFGMTWIS